MKKCSTQLSALAVSVWLGLGMIAGAAMAPQAALAAQSGSALELAKDAPDRYTVVKGDTLWDISGRFLQKPWRWPELWQLNREQIRDPHWIYPGDVVYLDMSSGTPRLRLGKSVGSGTSAAAGERRESIGPMARSQPLERGAIPTISAAAIDAFLNRPLIVDEKGLAEHPRIIGTQEGRLYLGRGDLAYARGMTDNSVSEWHVYRPSKPLLDPDTRKPIAYEALYVGSARLEREGDPATLRIIGTSEEVGTGDRLMPAERARILNYAPHPPDGEVRGRIVSVYRGVTQAGRNSVVALNVGKDNGVEVGHVLAVKSLGATVLDREAPKPVMVKLPDESTGYLLVFRVFDKIAYGLIMDAQRSISVGDVITNP